MTDDLTVTEASSGSDAGSAAGPSSDDERIKGFQRAISAKSEEAAQARAEAQVLRSRIENLELSQMSDSDREGFLTAREKSEYERVIKENERLKMGQKYPDVAPHYEALIGAKTVEEQALILQRILNPKGPATASGTDISDVDMNNPMRLPSDPISLPPGVVNDDATADRILNMWGKRPVRG